MSYTVKKIKDLKIGELFTLGYPDLYKNLFYFVFQRGDYTETLDDEGGMIYECPSLSDNSRSAYLYENTLVFTGIRL